MYRSSVRRAYFGASPHMWPFFAWATLVKWSLLVTSSVIAFFFVLGQIPFDVVGLVVFAFTIGLSFAIVGLLPAGLLVLLDMALVRRPKHRPVRFNAKPHRYDRQRIGAWLGSGALVGAAFAAAYSVIYVNAFSPASSLSSLIADAVPRLVVGGAGVGWLVAAAMNISHRWVPARNYEQQTGRGALLWTATLIGFGWLALLTGDATLERTLLPAALFAVIGAVVVPPMATTPPVDPAVAPPPAPKSALSPRLDGPEGDAGEGANKNPEAASAAPTSSIDDTSIEERTING